MSDDKGVLRWDVLGDDYCAEDAAGEWVRFTDHEAALRAERERADRLAARVRELEELSGRLSNDLNTSRIGELELRQAVREYLDVLDNKPGEHCTREDRLSELRAAIAAPEGGAA